MEEENEEIEDTGDDLREALTDAFDAEPAEEGPTRDDKGRFAAKDEEPESEAEEPPAEEPAEESTGDEPQAEPEAVEEAPQAPASWKAEYKEVFSALPKEARDYILQREEEMDSGVTQLKTTMDDKAKVADEFQQIVTPYIPYLQSKGDTPLVAFQGALNMVHTLEHGTPQQKADIITGLSQLAAVDINTLTEAQEYADPQTTALQGEVSDLRAMMQRDQNDRQQAAFASVEGEINAFASEKDANGQLLRPHYEAVVKDMEGIIVQIRATDPNKPNKEVLELAYDRAVWGNTETRQALLDNEKKAVSESNTQAVKKKAADAANASSSVTGSPSGESPAGPKPSLREEIAAQF